MIFYKKKYKEAVRKNDKIVEMYCALCDIHTRLLTEFLKLQLELERVKDLQNRYISNN